MLECAARNKRDFFELSQFILLFNRESEQQHVYRLVMQRVDSCGWPNKVKLQMALRMRAIPVSGFPLLGATNRGHFFHSRAIKFGLLTLPSWLVHINIFTQMAPLSFL